LIFDLIGSGSPSYGNGKFGYPIETHCYFIARSALIPILSRVA